MTVPDLTLNPGTTIPQLGFGTYQIEPKDTLEAVSTALELGYRHIDTAEMYENEAEVGEAARRSGIRDELIVTTKVPGRDHGFDETIRSAQGSLQRLGLDRIDLYLIHWPNPRIDKYVTTFRAMTALRDEGKVGSVGVSNFTEAMLTRLIDETGVTPAVNQVELHPYFPQTALRAFHAEHGIRTESWSPLAKQSELLTEQPVTAAAAAHGVSAGQVVLRWHVQLGAVPVPKSGDADRQRENLDVFGFELSQDEMAAITGLAEDDGRLFGGDPDTHEEM